MSITKWILKAQGIRTTSQFKCYKQGQPQREGQRCVGGGEIALIHPFYKTENKWSQVAYVIMMNNIQSTCIAIIIKHVFVVQVKIQGLYSLLAS